MGSISLFDIHCAIVDLFFDLFDAVVYYLLAGCGLLVVFECLASYTVIFECLSMRFD